MKRVSVLIFLKAYTNDYFFRNPERQCSGALCAAGQSILVCPADGKIVGITRSNNNDFDGYAQRVSIFLSPLDVHVQWAPMAGTVESVTYKSGQFTMAFLPKSSEFNERNDLVFSDEQGRRVLVRQIAGTIARRIVCWVEPGQVVSQGEKYGMIKFGSRVDIFLPKEVQLDVCVSQRVYGGETVLGCWKL